MSDYSNNLAASTYPKRNWYLTVLIVGSTLFAIGGVFRALFYGPVHARWLVAHAANELAAQRVDSAVTWLDKAYTSSADIAGDLDYWRLRFEILSGKNPLPADELTQFVNEAIESVNRDADQAYKSKVAIKISELLLNEMYFKHALTVLEKILPPLEERTSSENNQIAYTRSIAEVDLDLALTEINRALQDRNTSKFSTFFDTKAWILYKKGEPEKALKFADAAIKEWYKEIASANAGYALRLLPDTEFSFIKDNDKDKVNSPISLPLFDDEPQNGSTKSTSLEAAIGLNDSPNKNQSLVRINPLLKQEIFPTKEPADKSQSPSDGSLLDPKARIVNMLDGLGRDRGSPLHTTAVLRYHRATILDDLSKYELAQRDYLWLHLYGFTKTSDLY